MEKQQTIKSILTEFTKEMKRELLIKLQEELNVKRLEIPSKEELLETRYSDGFYCPHCGSVEVIKSGMQTGKQRYKCKCCKKTYNDNFQTLIYWSKSEIEKWCEYAECMINGFSIRKCAKILDISIPTSFSWRHKILQCARLNLGVGDVSGIVEADETFFSESFKGSKILPRTPHKRGKSGKKRGISNEKICVFTAKDRDAGLIIEPLCKGRMTSNQLEQLFKGHIEKNSILCTDSHKSYIQLENSLTLTHIQIEPKKYTNGIYHIQHINSLHSGLKGWMERFHGVATKYLDNYMHWFKWLEKSVNILFSLTPKLLFLTGIKTLGFIKISDFKFKKLAIT